MQETVAQHVDLLDSAYRFITAAAALGMAAFGLVDGTKFFRGGISNSGFGFIVAALQPFESALRLAGGVSLIETIRANWLNGEPLPDQKAAAKSLIRLGITATKAADLARAAGVDPEAFAATAKKIDQGLPLTQDDMNILGRFDALVEAMLDQGFERADQKYRNSAKLASAVVAVILALAAAYLLNANATDPADQVSYVSALFVGIVATPLAPVAKDLASSLSTAVAALKATKV